MRSTHVRRWKRLLGIFVLVIGASTCTDGTSPTNLSRDLTANLSLSTEFAAATAGSSSATFDQLRVRAVEVETAELLGSTEVSVSSTDTEWEVALQIEIPPERESVQVLVEVELLEGGVVAWSGRIGPIDVSSGVRTEPTPVEVYPGPLENLSVLSLTIESGGSRLQLLVDATLSLSTVYEVSDPSVDPVVVWSSSDPSVASVDQAGVVMGVGTGQAEIIAAAGRAADTVAVEVLASAPNVEWVGGATGAETDWSEPQNWNPQSVPAALSAALIPASAQFMPALSANAAVGDLTVETGAELDLSGSTLTVGGSLQASSIVDTQGTGEIHMTGTGVTLAGGIGQSDFALSRLLLAAGSDVTVTGTTEVWADAEVAGALDVGSDTLNVYRTFSTIGAGGLLRMTAGSALLYVRGNATFDGASTAGTIYDGTMVLAQSLTVGDTHSQSALFAEGSHVLRFVNAVPVTVSLATNALGAALQNVEVSNSDVLEIQPGREFSMFGELAILEGSTLSVAGGASVGSWTNVRQMGSLIVGDNAQLTAVGDFDNGSTGTTTVGAGATLSVNGTLAFESGSSFTLNGSASVVACLLQGGVVDASGGALDCLLTVDNPTHIWSGTASSDGSDPANWEGGTVPGIDSHAFVPSETPFSPIVPDGQLVEIGQMDIHPFTAVDLGSGAVLRVRGGGLQAGLGGAGGVVGLGTVEVVGGLVSGTVSNLLVNGAVTLSDIVVASGNVTVPAGSSLDLAAHLFISEGNFTVENSTAQTDHLVLGTSGALLEVRGTFTVGAQTNLSAGSVHLLGDFVQQNLATAVTPTGTQFYLIGTAQQTVTFATPGTGGNGSHFGDLILGSGADILMGSEIHLTGTLSAFDTNTVIRNPVEFVGRDIIATGLSVNGLISDGVHVVLDTTDPLAPLTFNNVVYQGFQPTDTHIQLSLRHPGDGGPYTLTSVEFAPLDVNNDAGNYLELLDTDGATPYLDVTIGPDPGDGTTYKSGINGTLLVSQVESVTWQ
ncbi:MAG: Ig-like domain-containing protein [Longimicrobiales bacterium]|nr:Ig-like domain-containing protein [Longimicrobiales bacterium]